MFLVHNGNKTQETWFYSSLASLLPKRAGGGGGGGTKLTLENCECPLTLRTANEAGAQVDMSLVASHHRLLIFLFVLVNFVCLSCLCFLLLCQAVLLPRRNRHSGLPCNDLEATFDLLKLQRNKSCCSPFHRSLDVDDLARCGCS